MYFNTSFDDCVCVYSYGTCCKNGISRQSSILEAESRPSHHSEWAEFIELIWARKCLEQFCFNTSLPPLNINDWNNIITDWEHCPTDLLCSDNEILCSLNVNISTGLDAIAAPILKQCTASIFCPLNATYDNLSICSGQIPAAWKLQCNPYFQVHW